MSATFGSFIDELEARTRITECIFAFCRGVDRADWALAASAFHPDAVDHHGWFVGNAIEGLVPALRGRHADLIQATHVVTNVSIAFATAEVASVESYVQVFQTAPVADDSVSAPTVTRIHAIARYVDRFELRGGAWRIAHRSLVYSDLHAVADTHPAELPDVFLVQRRDADDPIVRQETALGLHR